MKNVPADVTLLTVGVLSFLTGCSARVWRAEGSGYRILAIMFGLICITMGVLEMLGYIDVYD